MGKLIRQVEYGICYKYVKYGGLISVRFVCKIKDLSGVVVFSINNSSLIGNICQKGGFRLFKVVFQMHVYRSR